MANVKFDCGDNSASIVSKDQLKHLDISISICESNMIKQIYGTDEFNKIVWELQKYLIHRDAIKRGGDIRK